MNLFIVVNTVIITNFYYRTPMTHTMPVWLRRFFLQILPRILWMELPKFRGKQLAYDLVPFNNLQQSMIIENPYHKSPDGRKIKTDQVIFDRITWIIKNVISGSSDR